MKRIPILILGLSLMGVGFFAVQEEQEDEKILAETDLKEDIGQMLLVGFRGTEAASESLPAQMIQDLQVGGIILFDYDVPSQSFPRNILNPEQTKALISNLQAASKTPLFVAVDAEGGAVNRLKEQYGFLGIPSPQEMAEEGEEAVRMHAQGLASQLAFLGFTMNFAPVVDLNTNPDNPIIGALGRSFSQDSHEVARYAGVFMEEHQKQGIIPVLKHFPGHGSSTGDSHLGFVDVTNTWQEQELIPYELLLERERVDAIMTAHVSHERIDASYPATLSQKFIQVMLRQDLGFEGVIISDDMGMGAISKEYGLEEAIKRAVNAGVDILVFSNNTDSYDPSLPYKARDILLDLVEREEVSEERIRESAARIRELKER